VSVRRPKRLSPEQLAPYLLEVFPPPGPPAPDTAAARAPLEPLDWTRVFGNGRPVELEVGFGKGLFLMTASQARPDVNFLGCEIVRKYVLFTATRLAKRQVANVKLVCGDAKWLLAEAVAPGSLQAVHVYFPDPWWKKRHQKRRLFTADFVAGCAKALRPGGRLHLVTDVADYFAMAQELLAQQPHLREVPPPAPTTGARADDYLTSFERKFRKEGRPIYRTAREKVEPGQ
jgi:tRNA (guanine-N7-)-methyltransferase